MDSDLNNCGKATPDGQKNERTEGCPAMLVTIAARCSILGLVDDFCLLVQMLQIRCRGITFQWPVYLSERGAVVSPQASTYEYPFLAIGVAPVSHPTALEKSAYRRIYQIPWLGELTGCGQRSAEREKVTFTEANSRCCLRPKCRNFRSSREGRRRSRVEQQQGGRLGLEGGRRKGGSGSARVGGRVRQEESSSQVGGGRGERNVVDWSEVEQQRRRQGGARKGERYPRSRRTPAVASAQNVITPDSTEGNVVEGAKPNNDEGVIGRERERAKSSNSQQSNETERSFNDARMSWERRAIVVGGMATTTCDVRAVKYMQCKVQKGCGRGGQQWSAACHCRWQQAMADGGWWWSVVARIAGDGRPAVSAVVAGNGPRMPAATSSGG
ncbi:hypothetical protein M5K25_012897 [Dendrobium thyrsiflorum]|uniref:Uncharacterized protein n=1 Tax=Dendrobium thyrsiflorum TaxID=117978 RepID=A0ABD0UYS1_DENTH